MAEMAMQKPNASERRSRQARKGQDTEQTHVAAATAGIAAVQMQPESSASEPGKNRRHTMQFIGHMQDTASLQKTPAVQMPMNQNKTEKRITNQAACHVKKNSGE